MEKVEKVGTLNSVISKNFQKTLLMFFALFLMGTGVAMAQIQVRGTVVDEFGDPLIGATVQVRGTMQGTATDANGNFTISAPAGGVLVVTFIGYVTQEVPVSANVRVELVPDDALLAEVVVTALGLSRERRALGYSVTELRGEDIIRSSVTNPINALQGRVPGVQIDMGASGPQSTQRILIRGNTSIQGNNQPIFVVDGVIIENELAGGGGWEQRDFGNQLKNLNPDDFESVTILKGAAATALYGSRAANGVILITTKQGRRQQGLGINFSHTQQWETIYRFPSFQNEFGIGTVPVWDYDAQGNQIRTRSGARSFGPRFDGLPFTMTNPNGADYEGIWRAFDDNMRAMYQTGRFVNTSVAVSGGSETGSFRLSYSNLRQNGLSLNNEFVRNNIALNASQDIGRFITARAGFTYVQSEGRNPTFQGDRFSPMYDFSFNIPRVYNAHFWRNNYWSATRDGWNPDDPWQMTSRFFEFFENNQIQREESYRANAELLFRMTDWLRFTLRGTMNRSYTTFENKRLANPYLGLSATANFTGSYYRVNQRQNLQYSGLAMLTATHGIGDFFFTASVATERWHQDQSIHNSWTDGGLRVPGLFQLNNSINQARTDAFSRINQRRINSIFGLVNVAWRDQVYLDITGRNDWSSTMMFTDGTGNVSYFYPSIGTSWVISETFRGRMPYPFSFARVRASYAVVGSDTSPYLITNPGIFRYRGSFTDPRFDTGRFPVFDFVNDDFGSRAIQPEMQHAIEAGFDVRFFNNRLGLDVAYYRTNTHNQIIFLPWAIESGVGRRLINAGNIQNQGVEILLTGTPIRTRDVTWDLGLNFTRNRNKVVELHENVDRLLLVGNNEMGAWAVAGGSFGDIFSTYAFRRDEDGNKLINAGGQYLRSNSPVHLGNISPAFLAGFTSNFRWRNLSFNAVIDSRFGGHIWSGSFNYGMSSGNMLSSLAGRPGHGGLPRNIGTVANPNIVYDGMIPNGVFQPGSVLGGTDVSGMTFQEAVNQGLTVPLSASAYYDNLYGWSRGIREVAIHEVTWVALRELSFMYDLPQNWLNHLHIQGAALGLTMRNVGFLYNNMPDNIHPEGLRSSDSSEFREGGGNVFARTIGLRLNLTF